MRWLICMVGVLGITALAVGLTLVFTGHWSTNVSVDSEILAAVADRSSEGVFEGIQVHGDWVIEVRNPDGTLANHVEFSNALTTFGSKALVSLVSRQAVVGKWRMALYKPSNAVGGSSSPCDNTSTLDRCWIAEVGHIQTDSENLTLTIEGDNKLVFAGSVTAADDGPITTALMDVSVCFNGGVGADVCLANTPFVYQSLAGLNIEQDDFSKATFDQFDVTEGQLITGKVVYTFGSK